MTFLKKFRKTNKFSSLGLVSDFLMKSQSRSLRSRLRHWLFINALFFISAATR